MGVQRTRTARTRNWPRAGRDPRGRDAPGATEVKSQKASSNEGSGILFLFLRIRC